MTVETQEEILAIKQIVHDAIAETIQEQRKSFDPGRYITFTQAVLGIIATVILFIGMTFTYVGSVQAQIETVKERTTKTEYQNQISIDDRAGIHGKLDHFENVSGEIYQRLARIETKLDEIKAKQGH